MRAPPAPIGFPARLDPLSRVVTPEVCGPEASEGDIGGAVTGLPHDLGEVSAGLAGGCSEPRPERVPREALSSFEPRPPRQPPSPAATPPCSTASGP